jgi:phenylpropionate dioxygenase-like ring-hydroxylating dioxygenase large terminal subunit
MPTQSFLNTPYSGYRHNEVPGDDTELTRVGPGTPCGEWFRRFWLPVVVSKDLKDLPKAIRILGEDLVVFRDRSGNVGLLELHCSHRGTSLEFGQIEEHGIRCCYHAWCFDVDGRILDTPGEPAERTLKDRLYHGAYPTHEYGGLVFAYMGPPDKRPAFPVYDTYDLPGYRQGPDIVSFFPCNWLQVRENTMDPAHLLFLHTIPGNDEFTDDFAEPGEIDYMETPLGMVYIDARRMGEHVWVSVTDFILPAVIQGTDLGEAFEDRDGNRPTITSWSVPVDDTHTMRLGFVRTRREKAPTLGGGFGQTMERSYEDRQRTPGDYDAQSSQRPIAVHALEHLATTDRGVIMLRNLVRQGIQAAQNGVEPQGVVREQVTVIPTYSHDRVLRILPAPTPEEDRRILRETGRGVANERIQNPLQ